ncbi:MAG: pyruvate kinase [Chloroflexi bacterium]|nr:pyruvate kinase [Chloroflexota bacterium]
MLRRTKIVCTLGPASNSPTEIERVLRAGMNVARLNLSYGTHEEHESSIQNLRRVSERTGLPVALLMDLPGPKYRIGELKGGSVVLKKGQRVVVQSSGQAVKQSRSGTLHVPVGSQAVKQSSSQAVKQSNSQTVGSSGRGGILNLESVILNPSGEESSNLVLPVNLPTLAADVRAGDTILLDDGALQLKAEEVAGGEVRCRVVVGGTLLSGKGVVVPGMKISTPFMNEALKSHLVFAVSQRPDFIALSFVSAASEVLQVKELLRRNGGAVPVISKIERGQAVHNFDAILLASDGIMVARGDLGVDIPLSRVPMVQKDIIRKCNHAGKPVITATQMLESMINSPRPTRAEVTDVANAIFDGTDAVMLSAETSVGKYPVQAVRMMASVAREAEAHLPYAELIVSKGKFLGTETDEAISYDACRTALQLKAAAIVAFTQSGSTARRVSRYRPKAPVLALTPDENVLRRLLLYWGVHPVKIVEPSSIEGLFDLGARLAAEAGLAKNGDLIVITGGIPVGVAGSTNLLKVERVDSRQSAVSSGALPRAL